MKATFVILFCLLALLSCGGSDNKNAHKTTTIMSHDSTIAYQDPALLPIIETSNEPSLCQMDYKVILAQKDVENIDSTCLTLVKSNYAFLVSFDEKAKKHSISIFEDKKDSWEKVQKDTFIEADLIANPTLYKFEDMDSDGIKDILIKNSEDGRSNKCWSLFLVKPTKRKFVKVDKFEELESPEFLPKEKKIEATGRFHGGSYTEFYKIENNKLKFIEGIDYAPDSEKKYTTKEGFEN
jgi:hypothetical protein